MIVLKYIILILISIALSGIAVWFRQGYIEKEYKPIIDVIKKNKMISVLICGAYILFAVLGISYQEVKSLSWLEVIQCLLLWDGVFLAALIDLKLKKIPNKILIVLLLVRIVVLIVCAIIIPENFVALLISSLIGMGVGAIIILSVLLVSKGSVGAGDLKLFSIIGFYFGVQGLLQIMIYTIFPATLFSLGLLATRRAKMKSTIPMAPFIFIGLTVYYIFL